MKRNIIVQSALISAALLLWGSLSLAAVDKKAGASGEAATKSSKAAPAKTKPVDINSASKVELKKLTGIADAEADRIIAGRPYLSKAHLVTRNVIPHGVYEQIRKQIIAIQKPEAKKK